VFHEISAENASSAGNILLGKTTVSVGIKGKRK